MHVKVNCVSSKKKKIHEIAPTTLFPGKEVRPKDMVGRLSQGFNLDSSLIEHVWDFLEQ